MPPEALPPERITQRICEAIKNRIATGLLAPGGARAEASAFDGMAGVMSPAAAA